uniref:Uncharacterized protein n=1 Tax=Rhizobium rhizogenes TaxID=359 RepID=A0A7S4ZRU4_RHIRH|nr:hypothetical protein pC5.8a_180 [Rhizobium rhizogenes]
MLARRLVSPDFYCRDQQDDGQGGQQYSVGHDTEQKTADKRTDDRSGSYGDASSPMDARLARTSHDDIGQAEARLSLCL